MQNVKKYFASLKIVSNFALSKNGDIVPCLPVQGAYSQVDKHGGQLSVGGRNAMQSEEKLTFFRARTMKVYLHCRAKKNEHEENKKGS